MSPVASLVIVTWPSGEVRSLKSIAWPLLAPVPVDLIVPALSIANVPVAVGLSVVAVMRIASPGLWMVPPAALVRSKELILARLVVLRLMARAMSDAMRPLLSISIWPAPGRMASSPIERMVPVLVIWMLAVDAVMVAKSRACPAVEVTVPALLSAIVPLLTLVLMRKASFEDVMVAPALLLTVRLPVEKFPDVSMARVVALIAPELLMTTPGAFDPPVQMIAVAADSVPPASIAPTSLVLTDFGVVSVTPVLMVKLAMWLLHVKRAAMWGKRLDATRPASGIGRRSTPLGCSVTVT